MRLCIIDKEDVAPFVSNLQAQFQVVGPVARESKFVFAPISHAGELRLDYDTTILPPKKVFFPPHETLFTFQPGDLFSIHPLLDLQRRVLFGVHTCDMHAMKLLDRAFTQDYRDTHYLKRRDNTIVVGIECLTPCDEYSFCKSMDTLGGSDGYDLHLTDIGDRYAIDIGTDKGEELLAHHARSRQATRDDVASLNRVLSEKWPRFTYKLDFDAGELPALMAMSYKSRLWDELAEKCMGCGQCTVVCPTCYCFNMADEVSLDGTTGVRRRSWDCCQLEEFARVASGENFRKSLGQRERHRLFRKAKYLHDRFGELGCVGCGRCARACLLHISPVTVFNSLHQARTA